MPVITRITLTLYLENQINKFDFINDKLITEYCYFIVSYKSIQTLHIEHL